MSPTTRLWSCYAMRSESAMQVSLPRLSTSFFCFVLRILLFLFTQLFAPANHLVPYLLVCILLIVFFPSSNLISFFLLHLFLLLIFSSSISSYFFFLFCSFSCFVALLFPSFVSQSSFILSFLFFFSVIITVITVASRWYTTTSLRTPDF